VRGPITGEDAVSKCFVPLLALDEVMGQLLVVVGKTIGIELFDRAADRSMQLLSALDEQALVRDVLDDRVLEDVGGLGQEPLLVDDLQRFQFLKESLQLDAGEARDALEQAAEELTTDHRGELHGTLAVLAEAVEARHDDVVDGVRDHRVADRPHDTKAAVFALENPEVEQRFGHFLDEQRHPFRLVEQRPRDVRREPLDAEHPADHGQGLGFR
jgi:hypothetical protein